MPTSAHVLVVDDEPKLRRLLRGALTAEGFDVDCATEGCSALERARAGHFDAVVLDLGLPGLDGIEVCRRLRTSGSDVPVVVLTARDALDDYDRAMSAGCNGFLLKPFVLGDLVAQLRELTDAVDG